MKKALPINPISLGIIFGYLFSIEAPDFVLEIARDIQSKMDPKFKRKPLGAKDDNSPDEEDEEEEDEEEEGEAEEAESETEDSVYERFKKLPMSMSPLQQSDKLDMDIKTVYTYRARRKKELQETN